MKTITNFIKKHDNISMLVMIIIIVFGFTFNNYLDANDELWNFSNIYKMTNGYTIYKDINVIITPLFFWIGEIVLSIFGANYLIFRTYQIGIIYILFFFTIYQLLKKLDIKKENSVMFTILTIITFLTVFLDASYNIFSLILVLLGIMNLIKSKNTLKSVILSGIIAFLVFLTKQNIGIYYLIGLTIYQILINKDIKKIIKVILAQTVTFITLLAIFLGYLQLKDILSSFINYAFLGLNEFAQQNNSIEILDIFVILFEIVLSIAIILITYNKKIPFKENQKNNIRILGTFATIMILISYPLSNIAHILIGSVNFAILLIYLFDIMFLNELLEVKLFKKIKIGIIILAIIGGISINIIYNIPYIIKISDKNYYFQKNSPYYGAIATEEKLEEIEQVCKYIKKQNEKGIDVKVISYYSNLYMNLFNKNNGDMDLPFYGNMGKKGEDGMIEKVQQLRNTKILILTEKDNIYQESEKVTDFIKENMKYVGEIQQFSIYETE